MLVEREQYGLMRDIEQDLTNLDKELARLKEAELEESSMYQQKMKRKAGIENRIASLTKEMFPDQPSAGMHSYILNEWYMNKLRS